MNPITDTAAPAKNADRKAAAIVAVFALIGVFFGWKIPLSADSLSAFLFYAMLLIHTFLSVRYFWRIIPETMTQSAVDACLAALYVALAAAFGRTLWFLFVATVLFGLAALKYAMALDAVESQYHKILKEKIKIDVMGALLLGALAIVAFTGYGEAAIRLLAVIFGAATLYYLVIRPYSYIKLL